MLRERSRPAIVEDFQVTGAVVYTYIYICISIHTRVSVCVCVRVRACFFVLSLLSDVVATTPPSLVRPVEVAVIAPKTFALFALSGVLPCLDWHIIEPKNYYRKGSFATKPLATFRRICPVSSGHAERFSYRPIIIERSTTPSHTVPRLK